MSAEFTPDDVAALVGHGRSKRYRRGAVLFAEGDRADRVVVLRSGAVKVTRTTDDGREIVLAVRTAGDVLGELSALDGGPCSATATALEPVDAVVVAATGFRAYLEERPATAARLLRVVVQRLREADRARVEFGALDTTSRVAGRLVALCKEHGTAGPDGVVIGLPISQDELAGWVGASREAVARALRSLRAAGLVATGRRRIVVHDVAALARRAGLPLPHSGHVFPP